MNIIKLKAGQTVEDGEGNKFETEKGDYLIEEMTTAEFEGYPSDIKSFTVEFNKRKMSLKDFFELAKKDDEACDVLDQIKKKKFEVGFKGSIIDFIATVFWEGNFTYDVIIRDGINQPFIDRLASFDKEELSRNI